MLVVERGCGVRRRGGVYLECGLAPDGQPLEHFLVCPVQPINHSAIGLGSLGVRMVVASGVHHVLDMIGQRHYPTAWQFVEECRCLGMSRRVSRRLPLEKLDYRSRVLLCHPTAFPGDPVWAVTDPCLRGTGASGVPACCATLRHHAPGEAGQVVTYGSLRRYTMVARGARPARAGLFMALPITNIAVVAGAATSEPDYQRLLHACQLPVTLEEC